MRTYNEFLLQVKEEILDFIPENLGLEVKINSITKTNDTTLDGLSILKRDATINISPTIYLNQYYTEFQEGRDMKEILSEIADIYLLNKDKEISFNLDLENWDNIFLNVINKNLNKELLKDTPHLEFDGDLAITFRFLAKQDNDGIGTVLLKDSLLKNVDLNELYKVALSNTRRLFGVTVKTMNEIIFDIMKKEMDFSEEIFNEMMDSNAIEMYVISNEIGINGSSTILFNDVFEDLSNKLESDLYILPSSIHELIVISTKVGEPEALKNMVSEVNSTQVAPNEILSNNIFKYKRSTNQVTLN